MSKLTAPRTSQYPLSAEFIFNFDDTMVNTLAVEVDFGKVNLGAASGIFVAIPLPTNAVIIGGDITTEVAFDAATYLVLIGDALVANRYLASTDVKGVARVALVPTGYRNTTGIPLLLKFTAADVCTTGKASVRIEYVVTGRMSENQML